jgi:hypothetical protein
MKTSDLAAKDFLYIIPASFALGASLASVQSGNWLAGFLSFSFLFLLSIAVLLTLYRWANGGRVLGLIIGLAFVLRLAVGMSLYFALPIYGHANDDSRAGYVFTDAHRRDDQAWKLAASEQPILNAFSEKYASDQYGGLLAFSAFVYRYLSPDAQRPLMLILLSAFLAALAVPFLWKSVSQIFGEPVAWASTWIFALYPESILLGSVIMREPYLLTFSAMALWGFVDWRASTTAFDAQPRNPPLSASIWLGLGLLGMLLVSPVVALFTLVIFAGWMFFSTERANISWKAILIFVVVFAVGLFFLSSALNRTGEFDATSPLHVINDWLRLAVKWDAYQLERDSGWVQKIFDEGPKWIHLPFVTIYGVFQPVLPATIIYPTELIWKIIGILRAVGWYAMLPMLILSFVAAAGQGSGQKRNLILWLSLLAWTWILLAALRGGGDLWDNPRYRTILLVWQALLAGYVCVWWRETRSAWLVRIVAMEVVFLLIFAQWYASRYFYWGGQLPFAAMVGLILALWGLILGWSWWRDRKSAGKSAGSRA